MQRGRTATYGVPEIIAATRQTRVGARRTSDRPMVDSTPANTSSLVSMRAPTVQSREFDRLSPDSPCLR